MTQIVEVIGEDIARKRISQRLDSTLRHAPQISSFLDSVVRAKKGWAVVGGALRAWAIGGSEEPSDIDIVVAGSLDLVDGMIRSLLDHTFPDDLVALSRTKLGGYRLRTRTHLFDIWPAELSVGLRQAEITETNVYRRVARSAALSMDSLVYSNRGRLFDHGFFRTIETGVLNLNHCHVVHREAMARKAVSLCKRYHLTPDLSLQVFIRSTLGYPFPPDVAPPTSDGPNS